MRLTDYIKFLIGVLVVIVGVFGIYIWCNQPEETATTEDETPIYDVGISVKDNVSVIYQYYEGYPAGCELAATCEVLNAYGYDATITSMLEFLPMSDTDFIYAYYGDIYSAGFTFPPAIVNAVNRYLSEERSTLAATDISGCSWEKFTNYISDGYPLVVWFTTDYGQPTWYLEQVDGYMPYSNLHCIAVYDIDDTFIYIADPINGYTELYLSTFKDVWIACGSYAILIN